MGERVIGLRMSETVEDRHVEDSYLRCDDSSGRGDSVVRSFAAGTPEIERRISELLGRLLEGFIGMGSEVGGTNEKNAGLSGRIGQGVHEPSVIRDHTGLSTPSVKVEIVQPKKSPFQPLLFDSSPLIKHMEKWQRPSKAQQTTTRAGRSCFVAHLGQPLLPPPYAQPQRDHPPHPSTGDNNGCGCPPLPA